MGRLKGAEERRKMPFYIALEHSETAALHSSLSSHLEAVVCPLFADVI